MMCKGCYSMSGSAYLMSNTSSYSPLIGNYMGSNASNSYISNSELEAVVIDSGSWMPQKSYEISTNMDYQIDKKDVSKSYVHMPELFLNEAKLPTKFVGQAKDIEDHVKEAFEKLTGKDLPSNIVIKVLGEEEMKKHHPHWNSNINGFAINGPVKQVFVKDGNLGRVMLTIGHELGHVMSQTLGNARDEEAKAFAFELAWMKTINEHNIANLGSAINQDVLLRPANNGLHNVAFEFVRKMIMSGKNAMDVFMQLIEGSLSVRWF